MFRHFQPFRVVLVTGPQRSGTTICAKMIAHDTGHRFVREDQFGTGHPYMWRFTVMRARKAVIQCPVMARYVHQFGPHEDIAIVWMRRPVEEIIASQERIGWQWEWHELQRYGAEEGPIVEIKNRFWEEHQKPHIKHAFEVEYHELELHKLWVPRALRAGWHPKQIDVENAW